MSSDSDESSLEYEPERERLGHIWKSIQQTKNISQMIDKRHHSQNKLHRNNQLYRKEEQNRYGQSLNVTHLLREMRNLQRQNQKLRSQLEEERQLKDRQIKELRKQYEQRLRVQLKNIKNAEKENQSFNKKESQVDYLTKQKEKIELRLKGMQLNNQNLELQIKRLSQINQTYLSQLTSTKATSTPQVGRGQQLLELEQANQTVIRLIELLRKTQEYKQYAYFMQQMGSMHYLKNIIKRLKNNSLNVKPIEKKVCSCKDMKLNEKLLWSPVQCYKTMLEMKVKYDYLSEDCIEEVLFEMNRIYSAKQEKIIQKLKQNHQNDLAKLKKQIQQGYDEILTKKQINRLKKELKDVKNSQKIKVVPKMEHLRDKGQLQDLLKLKEKQVKLLKERLKLFETENGFQEKALYYEGTLNTLDKVLSELDNNEASLKEFEVRFRQRVEENMEPEDWLLSYKQFFQALESLRGELAERLLGFKEAILMKMKKGQ